MKKLIVLIVVASMIASYISNALAQSSAVKINKTVVCDDTKTLLDTLLNEYNESPVWAGTDEKSKYGLLINQETGTWTMIQFDKNTTCILGVGENSRAISFGKPKTTL